MDKRKRRSLRNDSNKELSSKQQYVLYALGNYKMIKKYSSSFAYSISLKKII